MRNVYEVLKEKGITLPQPPAKEAFIHRSRSWGRNFSIAQAAVRIWETAIR